MQVEDFFTHLLQRVVPKHDTQARAEVTVTRPLPGELLCGPGMPSAPASPYPDLQTTERR